MTMNSLRTPSLLTLALIVLCSVGSAAETLPQPIADALSASDREELLVAATARKEALKAFVKKDEWGITAVHDLSRVVTLRWKAYNQEVGTDTRADRVFDLYCRAIDTSVITQEVATTVAAAIGEKPAAAIFLAPERVGKINSSLMIMLATAHPRWEFGKDSVYFRTLIATTIAPLVYDTPNEDPQWFEVNPKGENKPPKTNLIKAAIASDARFAAVFETSRIPYLPEVQNFQTALFVGDGSDLVQMIRPVASKHAASWPVWAAKAKAATRYDGQPRYTCLANADLMAIYAPKP